jgi:uncharacterized protein YqjF (DUF2071 family)
MTSERFDPFPTERVSLPVMHQSWTLATFVHWPYRPSQIRPLLPEGLELDTFDNSAWVSLSPFLLDGLRILGLPPLPWISTTPETNVRTYVRGPDGRRGILFLSLDIARFPAVLAGRAVYRLPYMWARMRLSSRDDMVAYRGRRRWGGPEAAWHLRVDHGIALHDEQLGALDHFLTGRWLMFARYGRFLAATPVEHEPWPLWRAGLMHLRESLLRAAGLPPPAAPPLVHYSPGVRARIGPTRLVRGSSSGVAR